MKTKKIWYTAEGAGHLGTRRIVCRISFADGREALTNCIVYCRDFDALPVVIHRMSLQAEQFIQRHS